MGEIMVWKGEDGEKEAEGGRRDLNVLLGGVF